MLAGAENEWNGISRVGPGGRCGEMFGASRRRGNIHAELSDCFSHSWQAGNRFAPVDWTSETLISETPTLAIPFAPVEPMGLVVTRVHARVATRSSVAAAGSLAAARAQVRIAVRFAVARSVSRVSARTTARFLVNRLLVSPMCPAGAE
jgi:hypothetical protein